ncbi:MAG TPA: helix-turn-helix transcriptional regulator [Candidatus Limnocylindrales bacterium]|nr:helix-turn-helix transcriptional regulator [Candidatus Limnocylindrales bacterium]
MAAGRRRAIEACALAGEQIAKARKRRGWPQRVLAHKLGISQARESQIEAGKGGGVPPDMWYAFASALGIPFRMEFGRDAVQELEDAGHLEMQEFMLRLGRATGFNGGFELATRPSNPAYSVDVGLRDDARRLLVLEECWNTFGNIGASVRSTRRKIAEAEALAVAAGGDGGPYLVSGCWIVRDTARNRAVLERYPEVFESTFTGPSGAWVRALTEPGALPPTGLGLVWCDPRRGRLTPWWRR